MANQNNATSNSQSLIIEKGEFDYISLAEANGHASQVKFQIMNPEVRPGDILIILHGSEVCFHGFISRMEDGWGFATDPGGSLLPVRAA